MMKKRITGFIIVMIIALVFCSLSLANDSLPVLPELKLSVQQSPLTVYPPYMIYTAQLSFMPTNTTTRLVAEFLNITNNAESYIGSMPFDKSGQAVLSKQMKQGYYVAIAKTVINGVTIWSNKVEYKVP